jgi:hypothetical protein
MADEAGFESSSCTSHGVRLDFRYRPPCMFTCKRELETGVEFPSLLTWDLSLKKPPMVVVNLFYLHDCWVGCWHVWHACIPDCGVSAVLSLQLHTMLLQAAGRCSSWQQHGT